MIDEETSLTDVAGAVAAALRTIDHDPVVVGGSAATIHAPEVYRSHDIDMVIIGGVDKAAELRRVMEGLGFRLSPSHLFVHDRSPFTVEFVPSPVAIAGDVIADFAAVPTIYGDLSVLHVADVVADRLNKAVVYDDADSFEVAVAVARVTNLSPERVRSFVERQAVGLMAQPYLSAFERFRRALVAERTRSGYGFTTAFRIEFLAPPLEEEANAVAHAIRDFLDQERAHIHPALEGIALRGSQATMIEGVLAHVVLPVETRRDLPPVERFRLAEQLVDYVRSRIERFPQLRSIPMDGTPPVATTGQ